MTARAALLEPPRVDAFTGRHVKARLSTLIVDDDPTSREILARILNYAGHTAIVAASAEQALELFEQHHPDMVLMDIVLPGMDGCDAMKLMKRARAPEWLPVILVSVRDSDGEVLEGLRAGADDYLTKPVKLDHVLAKVRNTSRTLALQSQLSHSSSFARVIMDHIAEALLCCDQAGVVQTSNQAAERLFGFGPGELKGLPLSALLADTVPSPFPSPSAPRHLFGTGRRKSGEVFSIETKQTTVLIDQQPLAVLTLRDVTSQLEEERRILNDASALREYKQEKERENALAREMLERFQRRGGPGTESVASVTHAATGFSGDVVAARRSPSGRLYVMLADATGHGLAAAISLVPALSVLHAMADQDCSLGEIAGELNDKMLRLLPTGHFLAAALLRLDERRGSGELWVGGVPPVLILDSAGQMTRRFASNHFAFGVCATSASTLETTPFSWDRPCQMLLTTDGVTEAEGPYGDQFGEARLLNAVQQSDRHDRLRGITEALRAHLAGFPSGDDASIALVDLP